MTTAKVNLTDAQMAIIRETHERDAIRFVIHDILVRDGTAIQCDIVAEVDRRLAPIHNELKTTTKHYPDYAVAAILQQFDQYKGWTIRGDGVNKFVEGGAELAADWIDNHVGAGHRHQFLRILDILDNPIMRS